MMNKITILILVALVALIDIAAIVSLSQNLYSGSNSEIIFLGMSLIFYVGAGLLLFKKKASSKENEQEENIPPKPRF
jgi:type II secretory pathway component PulK